MATEMDYYQEDIEETYITTRKTTKVMHKEHKNSALKCNSLIKILSIRNAALSLLIFARLIVNNMSECELFLLILLFCSAFLSGALFF